MKKLVLLGIASLFTFFGIAQDDNNLVTNPSFEATGKGKLKKLKQITVAENWESPTGLPADLFSTECPAVCSAPENQYGKEHPMDGNRYAGIMAYSYNNKEPRTYLQTELLGPLEKGVQYCVKFHVSLSDLSKYAVNNLGIYLTKDKFEVEEKTDIIFDKQKDLDQIVTIDGNKVFNGRYNWEPICNTFTANGKEKYLIVGNFYNNKDTKFEKLKKLDGFNGTQIPSAYYYIDQVEVFFLENPEDCDCSNKMKIETHESMVYHDDFNSEEGYTVEEQLNMTTVYFDMLKTRIEQMMIQDLDNVASIMKANPSFKIELAGYTDQLELDAQKKDPENELIMDLAKKRAQEVKDHLVNKGVESDRISIKDLQITESNATGSSIVMRAKNRKVTFSLIE